MTEEIIRLFSMKFILICMRAKMVSPMNICVRNIADLAALLLAILPKQGSHSYKVMKRAFCGSRLQSFRLSQKWLRQPFLDFIFLNQILRGLDHPRNYKIIEKNAELVQDLRDSGKSYIVATGHFAREAMSILYLEEVTPGCIIQIANPLMVKPGTLYERRLHLQYGTMLAVINFLRPKDLKIMNVGSSPLMYRKLCSELKKPGNALLINLDVSYEDDSRGSIVRPFAAQSKRSFAKGAVRLAHLTRCPIITCTFAREKDGTFIIEWGAPVYALDKYDMTSEAKVMNELLDRIESAIGNRPTQYILPIGTGRRWNQLTRRWENYDSKASK